MGGAAPAATIPQLLEAMRSALKADSLVGINLVAIGALLIRLLDDVLVHTYIHIHG